VQRANAEVDTARALLLVVNVTQMFVGIAGLGKVFYMLILDNHCFLCKDSYLYCISILICVCFCKHHGIVLSSSPYLYITFWH